MNARVLKFHIQSLRGKLVDPFFLFFFFFFFFFRWAEVYVDHLMNF